MKNEKMVETAKNLIAENALETAQCFDGSEKLSVNDKNGMILDFISYTQGVCDMIPQGDLIEIKGVQDGQINFYADILTGVLYKIARGKYDVVNFKIVIKSDLNIYHLASAFKY